jgi:hypothetical protein
MKHSLKLIVALIATAFLVFGCSSSSGSEDSGIAAPSVGSATDLAASGGTAPTTEAAAKTLFTDTSTALNAFVATKKPAASVSKPASQARSSTTTTTPYNFTATAGSGTVVFTGSVAVTKSSNQPSSIAANTLYKNISAVSESGTINGVLTNATVTYGAHTYVINGKITNTVSQSFAFDYLTGTDTTKFTDMKIYLTYAIGLGVGSAFSVKRDDGVGAKFIITYSANYAKANVLVSDLSAFVTELQNYLTGQTATLSVYDDSNNLVFKSTLTQADAYNYSIFGD